MQNEPGASALTWDAWWDDHYRTDLTFSRRDLHTLHQFSFLSTARDAQRPPQGDWRTWLFMGGRGAGKTRAGAEWVRFAALHGQCERIALIGPTLGDVREVMIEGPSGLRSIEPLDAFRPEFNVSRRRLEYRGICCARRRDVQVWNREYVRIAGSCGCLGLGGVCLDAERRGRTTHSRALAAGPEGFSPEIFVFLWRRFGRDFRW